MSISSCQNNITITAGSSLFSAENFPITSKILPNCSWEGKTAAAKIGKIFFEIIKTLVCLTLIVPAITLTADLIINLGKKISYKNIKIVEQKKEEKLTTLNKVFIIGGGLLCAGLFYFRGQLFQSLVSNSANNNTINIPKSAIVYAKSINSNNTSDKVIKTADKVIKTSKAAFFRAFPLIWLLNKQCPSDSLNPFQLLFFSLDCLDACKPCSPLAW